MNCKAVLDENFLREILSKSFITGEYKRVQKEKLIDLELSYLPETMPYVDQYKAYQSKNIKLSQISSKLDRFKAQYTDLNHLKDECILFCP
jgi:hypothetical protein